MDWLDEDNTFLPTTTAASVSKFNAKTSASERQVNHFNKFQEAIPVSLIKEQCQLILDQNASIDDLTNAIEKCKELVLNTDECSTERKWLVRHLVELRFRLKEMEEVNSDTAKTGSMYKVTVLVCPILVNEFKINFENLNVNEIRSFLVIISWIIIKK